MPPARGQVVLVGGIGVPFQRRSCWQGRLGGILVMRGIPRLTPQPQRQRLPLPPPLLLLPPLPPLLLQLERMSTMMVMVVRRSMKTMRQ